MAQSSRKMIQIRMKNLVSRIFQFYFFLQYFYLLHTKGDSKEGYIKYMRKVCSKIMAENEKSG